MEEKDLLIEILEITKEVKGAVVKEKKSSSGAERQKKFKKIGTNLNADDAIELEKHLESKGLNVSQYVKKLIDDDRNKEIDPPKLPPQQEEDNKIEQYAIKVIHQDTKIKELKSELLTIKQMSIWQLIAWKLKH